MQTTAFKLTITIFIITLVILCAIALFVLLVIHSRKRYNHFHDEKEALKDQFEQTLLQTQLEIKEQTLRHLSWELHDNLGQVASLIKINLNTLQLQEPVLAAEKVEDTKHLVRKLIKDLKQLSVSLSSEGIEQQGLVAALQTEMIRLQKTGSFETSLLTEGDIPELESGKLTLLYRMCQEILNNTLKHSGATHIVCNVNYIQNRLTLAFTDDGTGFDVEEKRKNGGAGLRNLYHRAGMLNAELVINSNTNQGTNTTIQLYT